MMQAPSFWHQPHPMAYALLPFSCLYALAGKLRAALSTAYVYPVPVICVGNVVAGGAGKTPLVMLLAGILQQQGRKVAVVSRGYGGSAEGPLQVDPAQHRAEEVGDEPLLIAASAACFVSKRRHTGIQAAIDYGADVILLDDGLQNPSIHKTCSFLVIDGGYGIGNGLVMPSGPLRESLASALKKTDHVVIVGNDQHHIAEKIGNISLLHASITLDNSKSLYDKRFIAFAGIGRPEKFFATLREHGGIVEESISFPDHHAYSEAEIEMLLAKAKKYQIELITTEKDYIRLPSGWREKISVLPISLKILENDRLQNLLAQIMTMNKVRAE